MAFEHYYLIRVGDNPKEYHTRCEKANGPREACRLAYGVIYDRPEDTCRYLDLGTRKPAYISQKRLKELKDNPDNWKPIPQTGK